MYLRELSALQQELFVEAAVLLARGDGRVTALEDELLDAISAETGSPLPPPEADRALEDLLAEVAVDVDDDTARRIFLLELAGVAVIDAVASSEIEALQAFAEALGLDKSVAEF